MRVASGAFVMLMAVVCHGQDTLLWTSSIGGSGADGGRSIAVANDGGFVVAGYTTSAGSGFSDLFLVRTDGDGDPIWQAAFGGAAWDAGYGVAAVADGGFVATGYTTSSGAGGRDVYLVKVDSEGSLEWARTFGGNGTDVGRSVVATGDGGFAICGSTESFGAGEDDVYLIKTDDTGHAIWSRTFGGAAADTGRSVAATHDGGFLLAGATGSFGGGNRDIWIIKVDGDGNEVWSTAVGSNSNFDWGSSAVQARDGGAFAVGSCDVHGSDLLSMLLVRTDQDGHTLWQERFGEGFYDYGNVGIETVDGDLLAVGVTKSSQSLTNDAYLKKTDASGEELWTEIIGGEGSQWVQSVAETVDGYVVAGATDSTDSNGHDLWIAKISNVTAQFAVATTQGYAPLEISFEDLSTGLISAWRWDFDGDDDVDSEEQNPTWIYDQPGVYSVQLEVVSGSASRTLVRENLIEVSLNPRTPRRPSGRIVVDSP